MSTSCFSTEVNTFVSLSVKVPVFAALSAFVTDIVIPWIKIKLLRRTGVKIEWEPFLLRLLVAIVWPALLCVFFDYRPNGPKIVG